MTGGLHQLWLDDIDLVNADPTLPYQIEAIRGFDPSNPVSAETAVRSLLRDGSMVTADPDGNRSPVIPVRVTGADSLSLAQGEAALMAKIGRTLDVTWVPPDGWAPPSVFKILNSSLELVFDDLDELLCRRVYKVNLTALPYTESSTETVTPATVAAETVVDNGSSTTGWTALVPTPAGIGGSAALSVVSGGVRMSYTYSSWPPGNVGMDRVGAVDMTGFGFVVLRWQATLGALPVIRYDDPETHLPAVTLNDTGGYKISYFDAPASFSRLRVEIYNPPPANFTFDLDYVNKATTLPYIGTARQQIRSLVPGGSVRTQGSLAIESPTAALGQVLLFTYPSGLGWTPPLRPWLSASSAVTGDATLVSGARNALATLCVFTIPASILPAGSYLLMARMKQTTTATTDILFSNDTYMSGTFLGDGPNESVPIAFTAGVWQVETLGRVTLPASQVGPAGLVTISIQRDPGSGATVEIDEAWLLHESGDLTLVNCGTGAGSPPTTPALGAQRLWVDAPTLESPQGGVFVGVAADRSDSYSPGAFALARAPYGHNMQPAGTNVFVVTTNATDADASSTHFKRWHTHAAE